MRIDVDFPGGKKVAASFQGHRVVTDQPPRQGGGGAAPSPFDLFLSSIATCMGFYALEFCQARDLDVAGMELGLDADRDPETGLHRQIRVVLVLPPNFPSRYSRAVLRAMEQCTVKRHLHEPPAFDVSVAAANVAIAGS